MVKIRKYLFLILAVSLVLCSCSGSKGGKNNEKGSYVLGTDFGGDIALVGYVHESEIPILTHSNICIDKNGKELFTLPNDWVAAQGYNGDNYAEVPPIDNYIFAADTNRLLFTSNGQKIYEIENADLRAKYLLDSKGNVLMTPENGGYDCILTNFKNFKGMFEDGCIAVIRTESSYTGKTIYIQFMSPEGKVFNFGEIGSNLKMAANWEYYGNGIFDISTYGTIDLKEYGFVPKNQNNGIIYTVGSRAHGNGVDFDLDGDSPELYEFCCGKAGVVYNNKDSKNRYIAVVDTDGDFVTEPFSYGNYVIGIYIFEDGFMVKNAEKIEYFDFDGNLVNTAQDIPNIEVSTIHGNQNFTVKEYSSGFFRLSAENYGNSGYTYDGVNYIDTQGNTLFKAN